MKHPRPKQLGFTLIEVMVALVIVSIALLALTQGLGNFVYQQSGLQERVIATWVAQNRFIEIQQISGGTVDKEASEEMLGQVWQTQMETQPTLVPGLFKAEIVVRPKDSDTVAAKVVSIVGE